MMPGSNDKLVSFFRVFVILSINICKEKKDPTLGLDSCLHTLTYFSAFNEPRCANPSSCLVYVSEFHKHVNYKSEVFLCYINFIIKINTTFCTITENHICTIVHHLRGILFTKF